MAAKGSWVSFRIGDVSFPAPQEVLAELYADEVLRGLVIDLTRETENALHAVVIVDRLPRPIVVPIDRLHDVSCLTRES